MEAAAALAILDAMMEPAQADRTDLAACRAKIDRIDGQLLRLFEERMETAAEVAAIKKEKGLPVFDAAREQEILQEVCSRLPDELQEYGKTLFATLMDISKDYQKRRMEEDGTC